MAARAARMVMVDNQCASVTRQSGDFRETDTFAGSHRTKTEVFWLQPIVRIDKYAVTVVKMGLQAGKPCCPSCWTSGRSTIDWYSLGKESRPRDEGSVLKRRNPPTP
jgi:hypothetical protein